MMKKNLTREVVMYLLFGVLTTLINIISYYLLYYGALFGNVTSSIIAWVVSVAFAYVTNKLWVFESKDKNVIREMISFFACRTFTGILDVLIMYAFVDLLKFEGGIVKIASNAVVVLLNYIFSKQIIFKKEQ